MPFEPRNVKAGLLASALLATLLALPLAAQQQPAPEPAAQLVRDVIYNELHDPDHASYWEYLSARTTPGQSVVREQVETTHGPVFRILEKNGAPLTPTETQQETQRLDQYLHNPAAVARAAHDHDEDDARLASIMQILPQALIFTYDAPPTGDLAILRYRPNPGYIPSGIEPRVIHALTGVMTVDLRLRRMIDIRGTILERVDFGYGLLGHVDQGGTFEVHRRQVTATHWKTDLVDVHVHGKLLLLRTVTADQREVRSDFRPVPQGTSLAEAGQILDQDAVNPALLARVAPALTSAVRPLPAFSSNP